MFKKLREKLAENGNLNLGQLINSEDADSANKSVMEEESFPPDSTRASSRQRTLSSSSSEAAVLPVYSSPDQPRHVPQSDSESEVEGPTVVDLSKVSKEEIYSVLQRCKQKVAKYKNKYEEVHRALKEEKQRSQKVLTESQDKALRRINELKEQADLEQKAKAHLEENLRVIIDEKDEKLKVMKTKIDLLSNSDEVLKPFKEQVKQLNLELQSKEADVIMAKELRSKAEEQVKRLNKSLEDKEKELQDFRKKYSILEDQGATKPLVSNGTDKVHTEDSKAVAAEHLEAKMRASEKKLSQKESELRKIARKMHQLKLMIITEEAEEEENRSPEDGLAKKIEGSVDQLLKEKQNLQKNIDDLNRLNKQKENELLALRTKLEQVSGEFRNQNNETSSKLEAALAEGEALKRKLQLAEDGVEALSNEVRALGRAAEASAEQLAEYEAKLLLGEDQLRRLTSELQRITDESELKSELEAEPQKDLDGIGGKGELREEPSGRSEDTERSEVVDNLVEVTLEASCEDGTTKENEALKQRLQEVELECQALKEQLDNALNDNSQLVEDSVEQLRTKLEQAERLLAEKRGDEATHAQRLEELAKQIEELSGQLSKSELSSRETSARIAALLPENERIRSELENLRELTKDVAPQLEAEADSATSERKYSILERRVIGLMADLELAQKEKQTLQGDSSQTERNLGDECRDLQNRCNQLQLELVSAREEVEKTREAKSILEKELKARLSRKEQDAEAATLKWDTAQKEKNSLETRMLEMETDFETKRSKLNDQIRSLTSTVEQLESRLRDSAEEDLRQELASLMEEFESTKTKLQDATNDAEQMRRAVETKSQELIRMADDSAEKERFLREAETKSSRLEAHYKEWIRTLEAKQADVEERLRQSESEKRAVQENAERLDKLYLQLETQLKHVEQDGKLRVADVEARLIVERDKMKKLEDAKARLGEKKTRLETVVKSHEERIQSLHGELEKVEAELKEKSLECESWEESLKTGDERNTRIRQELKEAHATIEELRSEVENKEARMREQYEGRLAEVQQQNEATNKQLGALQQEFADIQDALRQNEQELSALKQSPVQQENLRLRQTLKQVEEERERLLKDSNKMKEELARVTKQAELLGKEAKALRDCSGDEIDTLREQMDEYRNRSILTQERCDGLQKELAALKKQLEDKEDGWNHDAWTEGEWGNPEETADEHSTPAVLEVAVEESKVAPLKGPHESSDSIDALRMQLAQQHDEIRDLKALLGLHSRSGLMVEMPGPTEYEYLKNIMFNFMMGKETQTLCKVIAAVLRFTAEQTRLVTERHESLHKVPALYHHHFTSPHTNRPH